VNVGLIYIRGVGSMTIDLESPCMLLVEWRVWRIVIFALLALDERSN
jgi:hypothetical protein